MEVGHSAELALRNKLHEAVVEVIADTKKITDLADSAGIPKRQLPTVSDVGGLWYSVIELASQYGRLPELARRIEVSIKDRVQLDGLRAALNEIKAELRVTLEPDIRRIDEAVSGMGLLAQDDPRAASEDTGDLRRSILNIYENLHDAQGASVPQAHAVDSEHIIEQCINALAAIDAFHATRSLPAAGLSADDRDRFRLDQVRMLALIDAKTSMVRALRALRAELRKRTPL